MTREGDITKIGGIFRVFMIGITIFVAVEQDTHYLCSVKIKIFYILLPKEKKILKIIKLFFAPNVI